MALSNRLRDMRRKIKWALSSDAAFLAVTGKKTLDEIMWAYESMSKQDQEYSCWLAGKLKLDKHKGKYLVAHFVVKGKTGGEIAKLYKKQIVSVTKKLAKKIEKGEKK